MNSNPTNSHLNNHLNRPVHIKTAIEFGVRDENGQIYSNIKDFFLSTRILTLAELKAGTIKSPNKLSQDYKIKADKRVIETITREGKAHVIISFQRKTEGLFAVVRLFEEIRRKK